MGRLDDALNYAAPLAFGVAAVLHGCRLTRVMRWLKAGEDEYAEDDLIG